MPVKIEAEQPRRNMLHGYRKSNSWWCVKTRFFAPLNTCKNLRKINQNWCSKNPSQNASPKAPVNAAFPFQFSVFQKELYLTHFLFFCQPT